MTRHPLLTLSQPPERMKSSRGTNRCGGRIASFSSSTGEETLRRDTGCVQSVKHRGLHLLMRGNSPQRVCYCYSCYSCYGNRVRGRHPDVARQQGLARVAAPTGTPCSIGSYDKSLTTHEFQSRVCRRRIAELASRHRLPVAAFNRPYVASGALVSYGPTADDVRSRADRLTSFTWTAFFAAEVQTNFQPSNRAGTNW